MAGRAPRVALAVLAFASAPFVATGLYRMDLGDWAPLALGAVALAVALAVRGLVRWAAGGYAAGTVAYQLFLQWLYLQFTDLP